MRTRNPDGDSLRDSAIADGIGRIPGRHPYPPELEACIAWLDDLEDMIAEERAAEDEQDAVEFGSRLVETERQEEAL